MFAESAYLFRHAVLRDAAYQLQPPGQRATLHALALELIDASVDSIDLPPLAAEVAEHARLGSAAPSVDRESLLQREFELIEMAASHARKGYENQAAVRLYGRAAEHEFVPPARRVECLIIAGQLALSFAMHTEAADLLARAKSYAARSGDRLLATRVRFAIATKDWMRADTTRAEAEFRALVGEAEELADSAFIAKVVSTLAALLLMTGRNAEAKPLFERAAKLQRETGDQESLAKTLANLGALLRRNGEFEEARKLLEQSIEINRAIGNRQSEAAALNVIAMLREEKSRDASVEELYESVIEMQRAIGDREGLGGTYCNLANLYRLTQRHEFCESLFQKALDLHREAGNPYGECITLSNLGLLYDETERVEEGESAHQAALEMARAIQNPLVEGTSLCNLGVITHKRGDTEVARSLFEEGLEVLSRAGMPAQERWYRERWQELQN